MQQDAKNPACTTLLQWNLCNQEADQTHTINFTIYIVYKHKTGISSVGQNSIK